MNKAILLGGNHHNGLGLARTFGINGIAPYGVVIGPGSKNGFCRKSKYWKQTWAVDTNDEAIDLLLREFSHEALKPVVIPWSDGAAEAIDRNLDRLKDHFIAPSMGGRQGAISELMDKQKQVDFALKYNLPMAKSWTVSLIADDFPTDMVYPCIIKPVASYEGKKTDIRKCNDENETREYLKALKNKDYSRVLLQEFMNFDYELEFVGCCNADPGYLISRNLREWPKIGGTNSYFQITDEPKIWQVCSEILAALQKEKYYGLFDIELFNVQGKVYVNEFNWRNTGNSFFSLGTEVYYAVMWYLAAIGQDTGSMKHICKDTNQYAMNEATDLRHVVYGGLKLKAWLKDRKKVQSFALWYGPDLKPTLVQYAYMFKEMLRRGKNG